MPHASVPPLACCGTRYAAHGGFGTDRCRRGPGWRSAATRPQPPRSEPVAPRHKQETTIPASSPGPSLDRLVTLILTSLDDDKAQDVLDIDLVGKTTIADRMVVASGTSARMVSAMAQHLVTKLKAAGIKPRTEGEQHGDWVLVDAGDVIVHLFRPEVRAFYSIERIWQGPALTPVKSDKPKKPAAKKAAAKKAPAKTGTAKSPRSTATARKKAPARARAKA
jgi:ribosome silencing factor RsfS/YbeB/iojap